jgi:hypothetical protein
MYLTMIPVFMGKVEKVMAFVAQWREWQVAGGG